MKTIRKPIPRRRRDDPPVVSHARGAGMSEGDAYEASLWGMAAEVRAACEKWLRDKGIPDGSWGGRDFRLDTSATMDSEDTGDD